MNKGQTAVENFPFSKPTWEIMKFISEITEFISQLIFRAFFRASRLKNGGKDILTDVIRSDDEPFGLLAFLALLSSKFLSVLPTVFCKTMAI